MLAKLSFLFSTYVLLCLSCTQPTPAPQQGRGTTEAVAPTEVQVPPSDTLNGSNAAPESRSDSLGSIPRGIPVPQKDFKKMKKDAEKPGPAEKGDTDNDEGH